MFILRGCLFLLQFYISLGLAVGGIHAFPDGCRSGNHEKPWKNTAAKVTATCLFFSKGNVENVFQMLSVPFCIFPFRRC